MLRSGLGDLKACRHDIGGEGRVVTEGFPEEATVRMRLEESRKEWGGEKEGGREQVRERRKEGGREERREGKRKGRRKGEKEGGRKEGRKEREKENTCGFITCQKDF